MKTYSLIIVVWFELKSIERVSLFSKRYVADRLHSVEYASDGELAAKYRVFDWSNVT